MAKNKTPIVTSTYKTPIINHQETDIYLNNEVKEYALYVISTRALPNIMDGLRIGARKILYGAINGTLKKSKKEKVPVLIGDTMKLEFNHGDASLKNTIEQLGSKHLFEYCPLNIIGQTGTLRVPDVKTAARYLKVEKTEYIDLFRTDLDITKLNFEDGKYVEPNYFLPLIPITLLWRTNSPGFGFSFRSFSHDIDDVIEATMISLLTGSCNTMNFVPIKPSIWGIADENIIYNESKDSWYNVGEYSVVDNDYLRITDLPFNVSYDKYKNHLEDLKDKNYIVNYRNESSKGNIKYTVQFAKGRLQLLMREQWKFFTKMKLFTKIPNLTLNTIDTDGKSIIKFNSTQELVDGFVRRRLLVYNTRKVKLVNSIEKEITQLEDKSKFIQLIVDGKLVVTKRKISDIKADCDKYQVSYEGLKLPVSRLTQDEIDKAHREIKDLKIQLDYIKNSTIQQMYLNDLIELKGKISDISKMDKNGILLSPKSNPKSIPDNIEVI